MMIRSDLASKQARTRRLRRVATISLLAIGIAISPFALDLGAHGGLQVAHAESCFIGGTLVLMADFEEKPIELIEIGDYVMSPDGQANRVIGIEAPSLGSRQLFGFDGGRPFVTAEHPFMTRRGWQAIDPAATAAENPSLAVGGLAVTDRLAVANYQTMGATAGALALAPALSLAYVPVRQISAIAADPATRLYNLLLDGDHAYFADGFLVHNKGGGSGGSGGGGGGGGSGSGGEGGGSGSGSGSGGEGGSSGSSSSSGHGGEAGEGGEGGDASGSATGDDGPSHHLGSDDAPGSATGDDGTADQGPGDR